MNRTLEAMRSDIDALDRQLIDIVARRMAVCREIGEYKKRNNVAVVQSSRFESMMEARYAQGDGANIARQCIKQIFDAIHTESVRQQQELPPSPSLCDTPQ
jgi:chorismate mutase